MDRIEQIARLVRSKGVGVYFITQNPMDVPNSVSAQLGNRVQHALRAFTPQEQRAVKAAAETFRRNPELDTERVILELKVGEALVSMLENKGEPSIVQRTLIRPPEGRMGPLTDAERRSIIAASPFNGKYETVKNRESAEEILAQRGSPQPDVFLIPLRFEPVELPDQFEDELSRFGRVFHRLNKVTPCVRLMSRAT